MRSFVAIQFVGFTLAYVNYFLDLSKIIRL